MRISQILVSSAMACALLMSASRSYGIPGCLACLQGAPPTLTEQLDQADAVVRVKWVEASPAKGVMGASTTYEIVDVVKKPTSTTLTKPTKRQQAFATVRSRIPSSKPGESTVASTAGADIGATVIADLTPGKQIKLARFRAGETGDEFLFTGVGTKIVTWSSPLEVTDASYKYIIGLPDSKAPTGERLKYFMQYFEHPESLVSNDAYGEFANAPYEDIAPLADLMPREKLRGWVADADTMQTRLGLYGLLLGLCGSQEDVALMQRYIFRATDDFRLGVDGVMSGYLLLTKEAGLDRIDELKLRPKYLLDADGKLVLGKDGKKKPQPFSETYAAMQALRFMWNYGDERIPRERLRQSMRLLLDRPELADIVIADLARWKDWSVQDRLMELYGAEKYDIPSIKRAIVRYLLVCSKFAPVGDNTEIPQHVQDAKQNLDRLREEDPKMVEQAERFFFFK